MEKQKFFFIYIMPFLLVGVIFGVALLTIRPTRGGTTSENEELMLQIKGLINKHYVEPISQKSLSRKAIRGMVRDLDDYSGFLDVQAAKAAEEDNQGRFGGLGVHVSVSESLKKGALTIARPFRKGPARDAGILPGDRIVAVGGRRLPEIKKQYDLARVLSQLKGKVGSSVNLTFQRDEGEKTVEFDRTLMRSLVHVDSVVAARMVDLENGIGYFRITSFKEQTAKEMNLALDGLMAGGLKGLVMDLRNNGGGLLLRAVQVVDQFLSSGMIVSTRGRNPDENEDYHASRSMKVPPRIPMVVLINEASASASEAVAGALQDSHRGIIVGERSYGKGVVQTVYTLGRSEKTNLKITTSRYYTPMGRCIDRIYTKNRKAHKDYKKYIGGIIPDVVVELDTQEENLVMTEGGEWDRWLADEVDPRTPSPPPMYPDSRDRQLLAAMDLLRGGFMVSTTLPRKKALKTAGEKESRED